MTTQSFNLDHVSEIAKNNLRQVRGKQRRLALKSMMKIGAMTLVLTAGVVTSVLFPNPISVGLTVAASSILGGSEGIKHSVKRLLTVSKEKKVVKQQNKETDGMVLMNKVQQRINEFKEPSATFGHPNYEAVPSAPSTVLYPSLKV